MSGLKPLAFDKSIVDAVTGGCPLVSLSTSNKAQLFDVMQRGNYGPGDITVLPEGLRSMVQALQQWSEPLASAVWLCDSVPRSSAAEACALVASEPLCLVLETDGKGKVFYCVVVRSGALMGKQKNAEMIEQEKRLCAYVDQCVAGGLDAASGASPYDSEKAKKQRVKIVVHNRPRSNAVLGLSSGSEWTAIKGAGALRLMREVKSPCGKYTFRDQCLTPLVSSKTPAEYEAIRKRFEKDSAEAPRFVAVYDARMDKAHWSSWYPDGMNEDNRSPGCVVFESGDCLMSRQRFEGWEKACERVVGALHAKDNFERGRLLEAYKTKAGEFMHLYSEGVVSRGGLMRDKVVSDWMKERSAGRVPRAVNPFFEMYRRTQPLRIVPVFSAEGAAGLAKWDTYLGMRRYQDLRKWVLALTRSIVAKKTSSIQEGFLVKADDVEAIIQSVLEASSSDGKDKSLPDLSNSEVRAAPKLTRRAANPLATVVKQDRDDLVAMLPDDIVFADGMFNPRYPYAPMVNSGAFFGLFKSDAEKLQKKREERDTLIEMVMKEDLESLVPVDEKTGTFENAALLVAASGSAITATGGVITLAGAPTLVGVPVGAVLTGVGLIVTATGTVARIGLTSKRLLKNRMSAKKMETAKRLRRSAIQSAKALGFEYEKLPFVIKHALVLSTVNIEMNFSEKDEKELRRLDLQQGSPTDPNAKAAPMLTGDKESAVSAAAVLAGVEIAGAVIELAPVVIEVLRALFTMLDAQGIGPRQALQKIGSGSKKAARAIASLNKALMKRADQALSKKKDSGTPDDPGSEKVVPRAEVRYAAPKTDGSGGTLRPLNKSPDEPMLNEADLARAGLFAESNLSPWDTIKVWAQMTPGLVLRCAEYSPLVVAEWLRLGPVSDAAAEEALAFFAKSSKPFFADRLSELFYTSAGLARLRSLNVDAMRNMDLYSFLCSIFYGRFTKEQVAAYMARWPYSANSKEREVAPYMLIGTPYLGAKVYSVEDPHPTRGGIDVTSGAGHMTCYSSDSLAPTITYLAPTSSDIGFLTDEDSGARPSFEANSFLGARRGVNYHEGVSHFSGLEGGWRGRCRAFFVSAGADGVSARSSCPELVQVVAISPKGEEYTCCLTRDPKLPAAQACLAGSAAPLRMVAHPARVQRAGQCRDSFSVLVRLCLSWSEQAARPRRQAVSVDASRLLLSMRDACDVYKGDKRLFNAKGLYHSTEQPACVVKPLVHCPSVHWFIKVEGNPVCLGGSLASLGGLVFKRFMNSLQCVRDECAVWLRQQMIACPVPCPDNTVHYNTPCMARDFGQARVVIYRVKYPCVLGCAN